jgi:hypothetical protein
MTFHVINTNKQSDEPTDILYTISGEEDYTENNLPITKNASKALAKISTLNGKTRYLIKLSNFGRLYNPVSKLDEGMEYVHIKQKLIDQTYSFKAVSRVVFDLYMKFLCTKNVVWFNQAERELI